MGVGASAVAVNNDVWAKRLSRIYIYIYISLFLALYIKTIVAVERERETVLFLAVGDMESTRGMALHLQECPLVFFSSTSPTAAAAAAVIILSVSLSLSLLLLLRHQDN